ncbi:hypothetical protein M0P65_04325 [Candidatus Gracilibacteria bacterium]|nr:hypothetical protein [Candidatus Gracilibacteria bacterium]
MSEKNIHHIIPVSRNGRKCDNNEIVMSLKWHQKIHSVFGVMTTHEKILYLLDFYKQEKDYEEFLKCLEYQVNEQLFYLGNCFNREIKGDGLKGEAIIRNLENPTLIFQDKPIKEMIFQILNWDIKVLNENSLGELCDTLN